MVGNKAEASTQLQRALQLAPRDAEVNFRAALVYNQLDDTQQCMSSLEKAVSSGYPPAAIRDTPDFDHLRGNPRIRALLRAANVPPASN
jgi:hypothetical protein